MSQTGDVEVRSPAGKLYLGINEWYHYRWSLKRSRLNRNPSIGGKFTVTLSESAADSNWSFSSISSSFRLADKAKVNKRERTRTSLNISKGSISSGKCLASEALWGLIGLESLTKIPKVDPFMPCF